MSALEIRTFVIVGLAVVVVGLFLASVAVSKQTHCGRGGYGNSIYRSAERSCWTTYWFNRR